MPAGRCEVCGTYRKWLHKHHVWPRAEGGTDADGLRHLCANCHEDTHDSPFGQSVRARRRRAAREAAVPADELRSMYEDEGLTIREIARRFGTAPSNVQYWMRDYGIERRRVGRQGTLVRPPKDELVALLDQLGTHQAVADELGVTRSAVSQWVLRYDLPRRLPSRART